MPRIYKGNEVTMKLLVHKCVLGEISDLKIALYTTNPDNAIEFTDRYTIDGNIATLIVPNYAFGTMEDGVINYVAQGMINDDTFYTNRQSNYFLKTPTDYVPTPMPEEIILEVVERDITKNGRYTITPNEGYDGLSKVDVNVNIPEEHILQEKTVQTTNPITSVISDDGYDGLSKVTVDATGYGVFEYNNGFVNGRNSVNILKKKTINIEKNGEQTFYSFDDGVDGYKNVTVNVDVPTQKLTDKSISIDKNGDYVYYASEDGVDGYNMVSINIDVPQEGGGSDCNLIKESFTLKGDYEQFTASEYGADGFESVTIDAYDYGKQKYNEGYEDGTNQGGTVTTYPTIRDIYNIEDVTKEVNFKGTVAVCLQFGANNYMIVTDNTGAIYVDTTQPYDIGDECIFTGVVKKNSATNIRYMNRPIIEVNTKGNYVVMPTDAVELTNKDELYIPNEYGNAEMKYLYYQGEIKSINSTNGNIIIITPESVSSKGQITLKYAKEEWRNNLVVGDYVRMYMFTAHSDGNFMPTDIIKLTGGGSCNLGILDLTLTDPYILEKVASEDGYDGYKQVIVRPDNIIAQEKENAVNDFKNNMQEITITEIGTYSIDDTELVDSITFDGNSYFDTGIVPTENIKIEVCIKVTNGNDVGMGGIIIGGGIAPYYGDENRGIAIGMGGGAIYGVWGTTRSWNNPYKAEGTTTVVLQKTDDSWVWEGEKSSFGASTLYIGGYNRNGEEVEEKFTQSIVYIKIWTNKDDDSTMTLFRPKNMAQGGFGLVNSDGIEYNNVSNLGEGTTTFISEWTRKYGEGWKKINVNVDTQAFYNQGFADATSLNKIAMEIETDVYSKLEFLTDYSFVTTSGDNSPKSLMFDMPINYIWSYRDVSDGIAELRQNAFKDYSKIRKFKTNTIMTLGERAFKDAFELTEIDMSNLIGRIATEAFDGCSKLAKIICRATGNVVLGSAPFNGLPENGVLYLKEGVNETPWLEKLPSGWTVERI